MNGLIIGLGSMGRRRIRCLRSLEVTDIVGVDVNLLRASSVANEYNIKTYTCVYEALKEFTPDFVIISVPPKEHSHLMLLMCERRIPFFVEASVVEGDMQKVVNSIEKNNLLAAPSCTLLFHPAIKEIFRVVKSGSIGKVSNLILHTGQYLPDWRTYESVSDYYVSDPETGGAREIVPFELTWVTELFGLPRRVAGNFGRTIEITGAEFIDDTYNILLDYNSFFASITIDVVSRFATRRVLINGSHGQLIWSWDENLVKIFDAKTSSWTEIHYDMKSSHSGYNENIGENMYIDEIDSFLAAVRGLRPFPNNLKKDLTVLNLLRDIELSSNSSKFITIQ